MLTFSVQHISIARITQSQTQAQENLWKIFFHNGRTAMARLTGDCYRSRWWLILSFKLLDQKKVYSIILSRFASPSSVYRKLSSYLWCYV